MFSINKKNLSMLSVLMLVFAFTGIVKAQGINMGYVDDEKIKQKYPEWIRAQEQWAIEQKAWEDEAVNKQTELQELVDEYDKQKLILSDEKKKQREATIRVKNDALDSYTRQVFGPGGTAEKKQMDLIRPLLDNITKAIEAVALKEEYDVIFTMQSGLGYINESFDITEKVLGELEKLEK